MAFNWKEYWSGKTDGGHRCSTEEFLEKESREKLFHLNGGQSLLDFGCGSADLLVYFASSYNCIVGADFSQSMLDRAQRRVHEFHCSDKISLVHGNENTIWSKLNQNFDRISATGVIQYLTKKQINSFLKDALPKLSGCGKILLFDIVDPRLFFLFKLGLFKKNDIGKMKLFINAVTLIFYEFCRFLKRLPLSNMGYAYYPKEIQEIAARHNLQFDYVWSMYYEYRYHAILTPKSPIDTKETPTNG